MKHLVVASALLLGATVAAQAQTQTVFNTPDGPVMFQPRIGRAQVAPAPLPMAVPIAPAAARPYGELGRAQVGGPVAPAAPRSYGGGFIEMLMTGSEPGTRPMRPYPAAAARMAEPYADPMVAYRRQAALQAQPGVGEGIQRVVPPEFHRQLVDYDGRQSPGTIVIDTPNKFLYLVQGGGKAIRYGIGVGRPGFAWAGMKTVSMKREWPDWRPPAEMLRRRPDLPRFMAGGPANPLGARALYLGSSLYRIHGTNEPWTIGQAVSSGCIRMMNEDVVDLYDRARVGTRVLVI
jgi:lipoprotein-anchoring transpeptidase ErfK/SrfK